MMSIANLMNRAQEQDLKSGDTLKITPCEMAEVIFEMNQLDCYPSKPQPPVKSSSGGYGFFSAHSSIEYDHHAPEYLKQLREYEIRIKAWKARNENKDYKNVGLQTGGGFVRLEVEVPK